MAIKKCLCRHAEQDRLHGDGMRVANVVPAPSGGNSYRCTVCGKDIVPAKAVKKKAVKK